jgi:hypothetical protein
MASTGPPSEPAADAGPPRTRRAAIAARLASGNTSGLLFGAVVSGSALAISSGHVASADEVALAVGVVLIVYWLAHMYVRLLVDRLDLSSAPRRQRGREALLHEAAILAGGVPGLVAFTLASVLGASASGAAYVALWATVGFLAGVGYLAGHRAGATGWALAVETAGAGLLGVVAVAMHALLH